MDKEFLTAANAWAAASPAVSTTLFFFSKEAFKNLLPIVLFWGLWFSCRNETCRRARERLLGVLLVAVAAMVVARVLANFLPHRPRPVHDPDVQIVVLDWVNTTLLENWSAFPSDHAVLFFALAVGLYQVSRLCGVVALLHASLVVCLTRVATGLHWPSDIGWGAIIGIATALLLLRPMTALVNKSGIVPYFEAREAVGYPLLFLATYEVSRMFHSVRQITELALN